MVRLPVTDELGQGSQLPSKSVITVISENAGFPSSALLGNGYSSGMSLPLDRPLGVYSQGYIGVDVGTPNCELAKVASITGNTATLTASLAQSHAQNARVAVVQGSEVPDWWFGVVGDNSTADDAALQQAVDQIPNTLLWLTGQKRTSSLRLPLLMPLNMKYRLKQFQANAAFAPGDTTNCMGLPYTGLKQTVTGATATNLITAPSVSGLSTAVGVVFKGSSLPGGIVAGRQYYVLNVNGGNKTFQLASSIANANGGTADVTITSDGSGTCYYQVCALGTWYFDDIYFNTAGVAGVNGVALNVQQQSAIRKLRADNAATGCWGMWLAGQQCEFENFESIGCDTAIECDGASFMDFYKLDIEAFVTRAVHVRTAAQATMNKNQIGGLINWHVIASHFETGANTPTAGFDCEGNHTGLVIDSPWSAWNHTSGTFLWSHNTDPTRADYEVRRLRGTFPVSAGHLLLNDTQRNVSIDAVTDAGGLGASFRSAAIPSIGTNKSPAEWILGPNGGYIKVGSGNNQTPRLEIRPDSGQTVNSIAIDDTTGAAQFQVTPTGKLLVPQLCPTLAAISQSGGGTKILDASVSPWQTITVSDATAFTLGSPSNPPTSSQSSELTVEVLNSSGGAMGAITWNSHFVFAGFTWANPASTKRRFARFEWNGTNWICTSLASADY